MRHTRTIEITVGLFMLAGIFALLILALKVSGLSTTLNNEGFEVTAIFDNIGGLKPRAAVTIAGVQVGKVMDIDLDPTTYQADVKILIYNKFRDIPKDSSASILTQGILGSNYISLAPGFDTSFLKTGDKIANTHPALILENLIGQLVFSLTNKDDKNKDAKGEANEKTGQIEQSAASAGEVNNTGSANPVADAAATI